MKKALLALFAVSVVATVSGCGTTSQASSASADKGGDAEVITGSRIPRKGGGSDGAVSTQGGGDYKRDKN
jgi:hypothetical protein